MTAAPVSCNLRTAARASQRPLWCIRGDSWAVLGGAGEGLGGSRGGPGRVFSPLRRHLGATCRQHGGQDGNLQATWPNLGRTGAALGGSWAVLGGSGGFLEGSWAVKSVVEGVNPGVSGAAWRIARSLWKTKSSKKRSLQKSKVIQHARATLSATGGGGLNRVAHSAGPG